MKPRLFCFGDSFVDWHLPKYHWTDYLAYHYDVIKLGKAGADNYSILFQLGNLPVYKKGDRIVMVFTHPGRLPRRYYGERRVDFEEEIYHASHYYKNKTFSKHLDLLRYEEEQRWIKKERYIEVKFLKNLKQWLSDYDPVLVTWTEGFHAPTSDFVTYIESTSNAQENNGESGDFHPGPRGSYKWYETLYTLLNIQDEKVDFIEDREEKGLI